MRKRGRHLLDLVQSVFTQVPTPGAVLSVLENSCVRIPRQDGVLSSQGSFGLLVLSDDTKKLEEILLFLTSHVVQQLEEETHLRETRTSTFKKNRRLFTIFSIIITKTFSFRVSVLQLDSTT